MIETIKAIRGQLIKEAPLIHCITNPISINQCANLVLAFGGRPIMAEHPRDVHGDYARLDGQQTDKNDAANAAEHTAHRPGKIDLPPPGDPGENSNHAENQQQDQHKGQDDLRP